MCRAPIRRAADRAWSLGLLEAVSRVSPGGSTQLGWRCGAWWTPEQPPAVCCCCLSLMYPTGSPRRSYRVPARGDDAEIDQRTRVGIGNGLDVLPAPPALRRLYVVVYPDKRGTGRLPGGMNVSGHKATKAA